MRSHPRTAALLVALGGLYFLAGKLGLSFATLNSSASAVWPPTGIALGAFLLFGYRVWPAIFVGAFFVNLTTSGSTAVSLGIAVGNTLEGAAGAWLVNRFAGGAACFERARDVFRFAGLAAVIATTVSATIGVTSLLLGGLASREDFVPVWLTWWLGDAVGALMVTPLLLLWHASPRPMLPEERPLESLLMLVAVVAIGLACFASPVLRDYPLAFLCVPPLAWIALRYGPRETATAIVMLAAIAVGATLSGRGSFVMATANESLLVLQAFMGMVALTLLPMAALVRERRLAIEAAEAATRARDVFLAMLSHELRNPLQAIANCVDILAQGNHTPEQSELAVKIAGRQSRHLTRLLNDLLDVARAASGKITLERRTVRLDEIAGGCVEIFQHSERRQSRSITFQGEPVQIDADAARIEQIVGNLLSNAIKFTPADGAIRVQVRTEGGQGVLTVGDNGIGIPADLLPRVFDLFTQGDRKPYRGEAGLGIGLTLVRRLAQLHGGSAEVRSAGADQGSEVTVRLPLASASGTPPTPPG